MLKFALETIFLLVAVCLAFFWTSNPTLSYYTLQIITLFVLLFFGNQVIGRKKRSRTNLIIDAVVFTLIVFLLIGSTGGLTSPLFFLTYFLMFGLAILFEPLVTLSLALALIVLFFLTTKPENMLTEIVQLASLLMVTPLALFFSRQYINYLKDEEKIEILTEEENRLETEVKKDENEVTVWETTKFKNSIVNLLNHVSLMLSDVSQLSLNQKERLIEMRNDLIALLKSGENLKDDVTND